MRDYKLVSRVWFPPKWPFQESTTMDSQLTSFSLSYSIEPHVISLPLSNSFAIIQIHPSICVTLETTIHKGGRTSVKNVDFSTFLPTTIFGCCAMTVGSPILSPRNGDPLGSNSISVVLTFSDDVYGGLTNIVKVSKGYGTFDERLECFSSATINSRLLDIH